MSAVALEGSSPLTLEDVAKNRLNTKDDLLDGIVEETQRLRRIIIDSIVSLASNPVRIKGENGQIQSGVAGGARSGPNEEPQLYVWVDDESSGEGRKRVLVTADKILV